MDVSELEKNIRQDFSAVQEDMMNLKTDIDANKKEMKDVNGKFDVMVNDLKNIIEHLKVLEKPEGEEETKEEFEEFVETPEGEEGPKTEETPEELPELPSGTDEVEAEPSIDDLELGTEEDLDVPPEQPESLKTEKKIKGKKSKSKISPFYKSIKKKK